MTITTIMAVTLIITITDIMIMAARAGLARNWQSPSAAA